MQPSFHAHDLAGLADSVFSVDAIADFPRHGLAFCVGLPISNRPQVHRQAEVGDPCRHAAGRADVGAVPDRDAAVVGPSKAVLRLRRIVLRMG